MRVVVLLLVDDFEERVEHFDSFDFVGIDVVCDGGEDELGCFLLECGFFEVFD